MIIKTQELEKQLKQGNLDSLYLLYGEETFLLETCLKKIKSNFGDLVVGINYVKIGETNIDMIISELETPAFGYEKKLIIVNTAGLFKKDGRKKVQANQEIVDKISRYLEKNIESVKESSVLVFIEKEVDKNEIYEVVEKHGIVCDFEELKEIEIIPRIKGICKAYKVQIEDYTAKYLIECCGCNMQDLINEIRKQIEYVGEEGSITKETIDLLCIKKIETIIFDLTDNLGRKDIKKALEVLSGLIYNKEPLQKILITLYNHFKKLYIVSLCSKYNKNIADSLKLKPNQNFLVSKYTKQANYFKEEELRKILEELINLDSNYKIGLIDLKIGLDAILCTYC